MAKLSSANDYIKGSSGFSKQGISPAKGLKIFVNLIISILFIDAKDRSSTICNGNSQEN